MKILLKKKNILILLFFAISCKKDVKSKFDIDVTHIKLDVKIERFDQEFNNLKRSEVQELVTKFPFLFSTDLEDEFWFEKSNDTLHNELVSEVNKVFPIQDVLDVDLTSMIKHLKYYYPQITLPRVVSLISDVDYRNRVILTKELLLVSLDCYLGGDHYFYTDIDKFIRDDLNKSLLLPDVGMEYAKKIVSRADGRDLMAQMILFGKRYYLLKAILPEITDDILLGYTNDEFLWLEANEAFIWRYFIEKDMLYNTDKNLLPRFVYPAPFSKFYLEIDQQSPDRVAQYIGFKIVLAFMKNNDVSLQELMGVDSKILFESSKYKPKK